MHAKSNPRWASLLELLVVVALTTGCHPWLDSLVSLGAGWLLGGLTFPTHVETRCYQNGQLVDCADLPAEVVAQAAVDEAARYMDSDAPVGELVADQLTPPLVLAGGGVFRTVGLRSRTTTSIDAIPPLVDATIETPAEPKSGRRVTPIL